MHVPLLPLLLSSPMSSFTSKLPSSNPSATVTVYPENELGSGSYGRVVEGVLQRGGDGGGGGEGSESSNAQGVAVKVALSGPTMESCMKYMEIEAEINEEISSSYPTSHPHIVPYIGLLPSPPPLTNSLVFSKIPGPGTLKDVCKVSQLAYFFTPTNPKIMPFDRKSDTITLNVFFLQLLLSLSVPHSLSIVHRDIKPENVILDYDSTTVRLLDYGSACKVKGEKGGRFNPFRKKPTGFNPDKVALSPIFCAPELFIDLDNSPLAFDIFSLGFLFLTYVFNLAHDEKLMGSFRGQLQQANYDLNKWLQGQIQSTILSKSIVEGLGYMKSNNAGPWKLVQRMIRKDPRQRPTVEECLETVESWSGIVDDIPFPDQTSFQLQQQQSALAAFMRTIVGPNVEDDLDEDDGSERIIEGGTWGQDGYEECGIPEDMALKSTITIITHFLSSQPLGLILEEDTTSYSGVFVKEVTKGGQADKMKRIRQGDVLRRVGNQQVFTYEKARNAILAQPGNVISLSFERTPGKDPDIGPLETVPSILNTRFRSSNQLIGSYTDKGRRKYNEDRVIRKAYGGADKRVVVAGVFDGHGGDSAAEFASNTFFSNFEEIFKSPELRSQVDGNDGSVLESAWNSLCDEWVTSCSVDDEACGAEYDSLYGVVKGFMGSKEVPSGTTTSVGMVNGEGEVFLLNCGDSRSVLYNSLGDVKLRTIDHKPDDEREVERLVSGGYERPECSAGGNARINVPFNNGVYQYGVSRSLESGRPIMEAGVSNEPEIFAGEGVSGDFIIVASDGFWDVMDNNNAGYFCSQLLKDKIKSLDDIAATMGMEALRLGSTDNVSVVVVLVK